MKTLIFDIPNISCHHCVHTIQTEVGEIEGVKSVSADAAARTATVVFDAPASEDKIKALLAEINYPAAAVHSSN